MRAVPPLEAPPPAPFQAAALPTAASVAAEPLRREASSAAPLPIRTVPAPVTSPPAPAPIRTVPPPVTEPVQPPEWPTIPSDSPPDGPAPLGGGKVRLLAALAAIASAATIAYYAYQMARF